MKIGAFVITATILCAAPAFAQQFDPIQAHITGGNTDRGKCTFEVTVDGTAEIEIRGAEARMRTLSGSRSTWKRMECNQAMPGSPNEFHFSPQDGRGHQTLLREPRDNNGTALVRLEDSNGGSSVYKFDLEWRGSNDVSFNSPNDPRRNNNDGGFGGPGNGFGGVPDRSAAPGGLVPSSGPGGVIPGPPVPGWNDSINIHGNGSGYYRSFHGTDDLLTDSNVTVDRNGRVTVDLGTKGRDRLRLEGRLVHVDGNRFAADMAGSGMRGSMEILLANRSRIDEIAMTGVGNNRFELRWQKK